MGRDVRGPEPSLARRFCPRRSTIRRFVGTMRSSGMIMKRWGNGAADVSSSKPVKAPPARDKREACRDRLRRAAEGDRHLPGRDHHGDDPGERPDLPRACVLPVRARRLERAHLRRHDLPLLPVPGGGLAHPVHGFACGAWRRTRAADAARAAKVRAAAGVRRVHRQPAHPVPALPLLHLPRSPPAQRRPAAHRPVLPRGVSSSTCGAAVER